VTESPRETVTLRWDSPTGTYCEVGTPHWWTVDEAADFVGADWLVIVGGPLAGEAA
jgi:hypothetical protein